MPVGASEANELIVKPRVLTWISAVAAPGSADPAAGAEPVCPWALAGPASPWAVGSVYWFAEA